MPAIVPSSSQAAPKLAIVPRLPAVEPQRDERQDEGDGERRENPAAVFGVQLGRIARAAEARHEQRGKGGHYEK
jgi:hypothetical protein